MDRVMETVINFKLLEKLDIRSTTVSVLPEGIGKLTNLKQLILSSCDKLETLPAGL